ncbi:MAG TPA: SRPBCC family protein [Roseiflexaceae bacterium]|nr:SRPBCC family protein [Roseiflexaceae bacterium]
MAPNTTRLTQRINAPPARVYRALIEACAVATWMVPDDMTSEVHTFDGREGGLFRISLTYDAPTGTGKTSAHTDTHHGRFVRLVPGQEVVEVLEFETTDDSLRGEMTITFTLTEVEGGTELLAVHENLPPGLAPADNELGWRLSLEKLARLVEAGQLP